MGTGHKQTKLSEYYVWEDPTNYRCHHFFTHAEVLYFCKGLLNREEISWSWSKRDAVYTSVLPLKFIVPLYFVVFGFRAQRSRGLEIGLLTTGGLTGLTLILAGIFNLWKSFSIRQFALFDQPGGRKSVRSAALILVGLNGVSSCASISLATVSSLLAKQFYLPDQFEIVVSITARL